MDVPVAITHAIRFALDTDEGLEFLRAWNEGDFEAIRDEWPDAPDEVFIGADPMLQMVPEEQEVYSACKVDMGGHKKGEGTRPVTLERAVASAYSLNMDQTSVVGLFLKRNNKSHLNYVLVGGQLFKKID